MLKAAQSLERNFLVQRNHAGQSKTNKAYKGALFFPGEKWDTDFGFQGLNWLYYVKFILIWQVGRLALETFKVMAFPTRLLRKTSSKVSNQVRYNLTGTSKFPAARDMVGQGPWYAEQNTVSEYFAS